MVATVRSARNSLNPGEHKGLEVMIKTSQWTSDSSAPLYHTLHPHETELGCSLHQIFSVSKAMLPTPSCLLWVGTQLFCTYFKCQWRLFTARKVLHWSSCWRHNSVAEYICVSWIHSQRTATHAKETKPCYKECLQHVLTKYMSWGRIEIVVWFCYPFMRSRVSAQGCGCDRSVWGSDPGSWWPSFASQESAVRICWKKEV